MKRRLMRICVLLILGAIVNVAVAWGCALWSGASNEDVSRHDPDSESADWWNIRFPDRDATAKVTTRDELWGHVHVDVVTVEEATAFGLRARNMFDRAHLRRVCCTWAGWPALSLTGEFRKRGETTASIARLSSESLPTLESDFWPFLFDRCLPLRPIWPGSAINTVFYAGVLWLLFAAPLALRRRRRIKRGLCPKCAYPVGTNKRCTECGATHKVKP